jgi:plasmid stability protein
MAQILIRNLPNGAVRKLKAQAKRHGRSLESEVKHIIENSRAEPHLSSAETANLMKKLREKIGPQPDSAPLIRAAREA